MSRNARLTRNVGLVVIVVLVSLYFITFLFGSKDIVSITVNPLNTYNNTNAKHKLLAVDFQNILSLKNVQLALSKISNDIMQHGRYGNFVNGRLITGNGSHWNCYSAPIYINSNESLLVQSMIQNEEEYMDKIVTNYNVYRGQASLYIGNYVFAGVGCDYFMDIDIYEIFFKHLPKTYKGISVEFGAWNGITNSNTFFFTNYLQWNSVLIEVSPYCYCQIVSNIDRIFINKNINVFYGGVCNETREINLNALGGSMFKCSQNACNNNKNGNISIDFRNAMCHNLSYYFKISDLTQSKPDKINIDFISMDCEGCEIEIIFNIQYNKYNIGVMLIEWEFFRRKPISQKLLTFLQNKGFNHSYIHQQKKWNMLFWNVNYFQTLYDSKGIQSTGINFYLK